MRKNNFEQTIKINYTGFEQIKTYEFNIVDEDGNKLARSYLNNTELKSPQTTVYTNAGNFLVPLPFFTTGTYCKPKARRLSFVKQSLGIRYIFIFFLFSYRNNTLSDKIYQPQRWK